MKARELNKNNIESMHSAIKQSLPTVLEHGFYKWETTYSNNAENVATTDLLLMLSDIGNATDTTKSEVKKLEERIDYLTETIGALESISRPKGLSEVEKIEFLRREESNAMLADKHKAEIGRLGRKLQELLSNQPIPAANFISKPANNSNMVVTGGDMVNFQALSSDVPKVFSAGLAETRNKVFKASASYKPGYNKYYRLGLPIFTKVEREATDEEKQAAYATNNEIISVITKWEISETIEFYLLSTDCIASYSETNKYTWNLVLNPGLDSQLPLLDNNIPMDTVEVMEIINPENAPIIRGFERIKQFVKLIDKVKKLSHSSWSARYKQEKDMVAKSYLANEAAKTEKVKELEENPATIDFLNIRGHFTHSKTLTIDEVTTHVANESYVKLRKIMRDRIVAKQDKAAPINEMELLGLCATHVQEFIASHDFAKEDTEAIVAGKLLAKIYMALSSRVSKKNITKLLK
jgi:hypothetical protein